MRAIYQLSGEAIQVLLEATADPQGGGVLVARTTEGVFVQANGKQLATPRDARSAATWQGAVRQLLQTGLLEDPGGRGEVFDVTAEGYRVADELRTKGTRLTGAKTETH